MRSVPDLAFDHALILNMTSTPRELQLSLDYDRQQEGRQADHFLYRFDSHLSTELESAERSQDHDDRLFVVRVRYAAPSPTPLPPHVHQALHHHLLALGWTWVEIDERAAIVTLGVARDPVTVHVDGEGSFEARVRLDLSDIELAEHLASEGAWRYAEAGPEFIPAWRINRVSVGRFCRVTPNERSG